jgi:hypothetical protein
MSPTIVGAMRCERSRSYWMAMSYRVTRPAGRSGSPACDVAADAKIVAPMASIQRIRIGSCRITAFLVERGWGS